MVVPGEEVLGDWFPEVAFFFLLPGTLEECKMG